MPEITWQSVKHTPAALYIMHQRPAGGLLRRDNMTYPQETGRERDSYRMEIEEEMRAGQQQGFNKSLQSTVCSWLREKKGGGKGGGGGGHSTGPWGLFTQFPLICTWFSSERREETGVWGVSTSDVQTPHPRSAASERCTSVIIQLVAMSSHWFISPPNGQDTQ